MRCFIAPVLISPRMVPPSIWHCPKFLIRELLPFKITMIWQRSKKLFSPSAEFLMGYLSKPGNSPRYLQQTNFIHIYFVLLVHGRLNRASIARLGCNVLVLFLFGILTVLKSILNFPYSPLPRQRCRGDGDHFEGLLVKNQFFCGKWRAEMMETVNPNVWLRLSV